MRREGEKKEKRKRERERKKKKVGTFPPFFVAGTTPTDDSALFRTQPQQLA
jgi:hypothetical protein